MDMLRDARIWLSGSIEDEKADEGKRVAEFVKAFALEVFRRGGTIIHGSHPTLVRPLLEAAAIYQQKCGENPGLALLVSRYFSKDPERYGVNLKNWNALCREPVRETREGLRDGASGESSKAESLDILRRQLLEQSNVIVAVGGKWWNIAASNAGVPKEVDLARSKHLPLFLLGGLGGSTQAYLKGVPELLRQCRNGLTEEQNVALSVIADPIELADKVASAIERLPLQARSAQSGRPFRILCLDGGGICGTFTAAVLAHWEKATGRRIADHFDLIAGTSTGGILAIGIGMGLSAERLLEFYRTDGKEIFPNASGTGAIMHSIRHWFGAKYDQRVLQEKLRAALKGLPSLLAHSQVRLLVPAYNSASDSPICFRTPHGRNGAADAKWEHEHIALATAAAPTYFDPVQVQHLKAIDGGVWANSPTIVALSEAVHEIGVAPERIEMLSVGTTFGPKLLGQPQKIDGKLIRALSRPFVKFPFSLLLLPTYLIPERPIQGILGWLPNIAGFLMKAQAQTAEHVARGILDRRFLRVDEPTVDLALDDVQAIDLLISKGEEAAARHLSEVRERFLNGIPAETWRATYSTNTAGAGQVPRAS